MGEKLFEMADLDGDGTIDRDELEKALKKLGFYHLSGAQLDAIMKRADEDDNCVIDYDEFVKEAPCCVEIKLYGAFDLHAIDATPARWRSDAGFSPLDGASTAASCTRLVDFHTGAQNPEDEPRQARKEQRRGVGLP